MALSETEFVLAPRIPRGLGSAVEGLAREILRHRPRDVYEFAAHHFEELVKLREKERDAGIVSTWTTYNCDSTHNGRHVRILDWTNRCNDNRHDSKDHRDHSRTRKVVDFIEETAMKELVAPATMTKLSKRRKEATTYRSGWSINQTVRAFKRHEHESVIIKTGNLDNTRMPEKAVEKDIHRYLEECTPRSSRNITHGQFLRSSSAGDILAKAIKCQPKENREKLCNCVSGKYTTNTAAGGRECEENYGTVTTLKRQKSADEIERRRSMLPSANGNEDRFIADSRKSHSPTNGRSKRNGTDTEQGFDIFYSRSRQDRPETSTGDERIESKDLEGTFRQAAAVVEKVNSKPEKAGEGSTSNELGRTFDCESRCDVTRTDIFEDVNHVITTDREIIEDTWSVNRQHSLENSIVLPSVVARPSSSSSNGYTKNGLRSYVYGSRDENSHGNDLILPPISSDISKPIKKENTLTLPYIPSKTTEVETSQRATISCDHRDSSIANENERLKPEVLLGTCNREPMNFDYDSISVQHQTVDPNAKVTENEDVNEKDKAACFASEGLKHTLSKQQTDEISVLTRADETEVSEELDMTRHSNLPGTDVDESFKDSLNVTPDSIELSQRSDSLEHLKDKNSPMPVDNDEEREKEDERNEEELECRQSNELKNKLIEIERVERNIENTLVSSGTVVARSNDEPPMPSTVRSCSCSSAAGESSCLLGNETTILFTGTRMQAKSEEDSTIKYSSEHRNVSAETERDDKEDVGNDSSRAWKSFSGEGTDADRPNARGSKEKPSKGIDLSCYVLTEGSPCEIPESVTTVIISDNILQRGDAVFKSDREAIENDVCTKRRRISLWNCETWREPQEQFERGKDPFGEYVCPGECGIEYSTSVDLDFLGGIKNAVNRSATCQNLGNIKEEEENERQVSNKENARSTVLSADAVGCDESHPSEKILVAIESENDAELRQLASKTISCSNAFDQSDAKVRMSSSVTDIIGVRDNGTRIEAASTESSLYSKEHGEVSTFKDSSCDCSPLFDASGPPYVPELNLDSLRDVTIDSSFERSDSRDHENQSDKENDDGITFHEGGQTLSSIDTLSSGKKATNDERLPSSNKLLLGVEELPDVPEDGQAKIENEIGECIDAAVCSETGGEDSPSTEEEIARELIRNMTLEAPILGESHETGHTAFVQMANGSSLSDYTNRTDHADPQIEVDPPIYKIPSPATIGSVDVASTLCSETGTSYQRERMNIDFQGERKEEGADVKGAERYSTSEGSIDELNNDVTSFAYNSTPDSVDTACETTTEFDNVSKDQDQYEKSEIKGNSGEDAKEIPADRNVENETPGATARKIQVWTREFVLGQRRPMSADRHPNPMKDLNRMSALTRGTSEEYVVGESPFTNDQRHERLNDRAQSKELGRFEGPKSIKNDEWSMDRRKIEINRVDASTTTCSDFRQTGEFHDSLPLPVFLEVPRSKTSSKDVLALTRMYEPRNGNLGFPLEPDASTFASESPRASVFRTVDLSETLRLIQNRSDWSNSPYSMFPVRVVHVERVSVDTDVLSDDTTVAHFARRIVNSGTDEPSLVREPLALVDETPKSILIEEISNSDEEKEHTSSHSCGTVIDLAAVTTSAPEKHSDRNDGEGKTKTSRDASSAYETVRTDNNDLHTALPLGSSMLENHGNAREENEVEENTVTNREM